MKNLNIAVLIGTTRKNRKSHLAAQFLVDIGKTFENVDITLVDPNEFVFNGDGNDPEGKDPKYTEVTEQADGFFIVSPEYNHSFPGSLKRMLDSELKNYIHKPVALASTSSGRWGGIRAIESLLSPLREMGLVATFSDMPFPAVQELFNEKGELQDKSYEKYAKGAWTELIWMAKVLRNGRTEVSSSFHS